MKWARLGGEKDGEGRDEGKLEGRGNDRMERGGMKEGWRGGMKEGWMDDRRELGRGWDSFTFIYVMCTCIETWESFEVCLTHSVSTERTIAFTRSLSSNATKLSGDVSTICM